MGRAPWRRRRWKAPTSMWSSRRRPHPDPAHRLDELQGGRLFSHLQFLTNLSELMRGFPLRMLLVVVALAALAACASAPRGAQPRTRSWCAHRAMAQAIAAAPADGLLYHDGQNMELFAASARASRRRHPHRGAGGQAPRPARRPAPAPARPTRRISARRPCSGRRCRLVHIGLGWLQMQFRWCRSQHAEQPGASGRSPSPWRSWCPRNPADGVAKSG